MYIPTLQLTAGAGGFSWRVTGLSSYFNQSNYIEVGITNNPFTVGGVSSISGIIDYETAPSSGSSYNTSTNWVNYSSGTFTFWAYAYTPLDGKYWPAGSASVTVGSPYLVDPWSWSSSTARQKAYNALTSKGKTSDFSYLVWNDFVDKIYETSQAHGYVWDVTYGTLSQTKMTASDKMMTAQRYNSAKYNVGLRYSTGIANVASGDKILGTHFTILANKLNEWINTL